MARILDFEDGFESSSEPTSVPYPASSVTNTPSGNLSATTVQAAVNELQGDIDTINGKIGTASGIASLDVSGKVPTSQIPALALIDVNVVANLTARNALTVEEGDVALVTDAGSGVSKTYIYDGSTWIELKTDGSLASHTATTTGIHGVTGAIVGTTDTQTLTNKTLSGASNTFSNIPAGTALTGQTPVANGGTGSASLTANNVLLGNGTSALQTVAPGTSGNVLTSNGTTWTSAAPASATSLSVVTKSTTTTAGSSEDVILASTSGGAWTLSLPTAVGISGKLYRVVKTDTSTNLLTIDPNGSETIFGKSTIVLSGENDTVQFVSDGSNWKPVDGASAWRTIYFEITASGTPTASNDPFKVVSSVSESHAGHPAITLRTGIFSAAPLVTSTVRRSLDNDRYQVSSWIGSAPTATSIDIWSNFGDEGQAASAHNQRDQSNIIVVSCFGPR